MRDFLSVSVLAIFASMIAQMGFLLNADVVNGHYLSLIGVALGLVFGALYFYSRRALASKNMLVVFDVDRRPWYQRPPNYPLTFLLSIFGSMISATVLNNLPDIGEQRVETYVVSGLGKRRVRYDFLQYIQLTNSSETITFRPTSSQSFLLGQKVEVTKEDGLLGFAHVVNVSPVAD